MWHEQRSGKRGAAECVTDVLTNLSRLMSSITVQTQANLESMFDLIEKKKYNVVYDDIIYASILKQITSKNQSKCVYDIN